MLFNSYKDMFKSLQQECDKIKLSLNNEILMVRDLDNDLIVNYNLKYTNYFLLKEDLIKLNSKSLKDLIKLNYKF